MSKHPLHGIQAVSNFLAKSSFLSRGCSIAISLPSCAHTYTQADAPNDKRCAGAGRKKGWKISNKQIECKYLKHEQVAMSDGSADMFRIWWPDWYEKVKGRQGS